MFKNKIQNQVLEFHQKFGVTNRTTPAMPDNSDRLLRCKLIMEEALEFCEAAGFLVRVDTLGTHIVSSGKPANLVEMCDAIADLNYVVAGSAVTIGTDMEELGDEVHRSNMTKVWEDGTVHKDSFHKIIKPPTYSPANIARVLERQAISGKAPVEEENMYNCGQCAFIHNSPINEPCLNCIDGGKVRACKVMEQLDDIGIGRQPEEPQQDSLAADLDNVQGEVWPPQVNYSGNLSPEKFPKPFQCSECNLIGGLHHLDCSRRNKQH